MEKFRVGGAATSIAIIAFALTILITAIEAAAGLWVVFDLPQRNQTVTQEDFGGGFILLGCAGVVHLGWLLVTVVAFLYWFRRAYVNLSYLDPSGLKYSANWAVGGFFVPILNLYRPYEVAAEIWQNSDPAALDDVEIFSTSYVKDDVLTLLPVWWVTYVFGNLAFCYGQMFSRSSSVGDLRISMAIFVLGSLLHIVSALYVIAIIRRVDRMQAARRAKVKDVGEPESTVHPAPATVW